MWLACCSSRTFGSVSTFTRTEWPWLYIFLIFVQGFFVLNNAGKSLGLDVLIARAPFGPFAGDGSIARLYRRVA